MENTDGRRVVITGMGMVTPLGIGVDANWEAIQAGRSGSGPITGFEDIELFPSRIAGQIDNFNPQDFIDAREVKKMDLFIQYALAAAQLAVEDSGFSVDSDEAFRAGAIVGVLQLINKTGPASAWQALLGGCCLARTSSADLCFNRSE